MITLMHGRPGPRGGRHDVVMEDCTIGDNNGSSPWAIKCEWTTLRLHPRR